MGKKGETLQSLEIKWPGKNTDMSIQYSDILEKLVCIPLGSVSTVAYCFCI